MRRQIVGWLRAAHLPLDPGDAVFIGVDAPGRGREMDHLSFPVTTVGPMQSGASALWIGIEPDRRSEPPGLVAKWAPAILGADEPVSLVPQATGLQIRYRFWTGDAWVWTRDWSSTIRLPEQVEIRILGDSVPDLLKMPIRARPGGAL